MGMSMTVSRPQGIPPRIVPPPHGGAADPPPFWELEDLIASGLGRDAALQVMAARRTALTVVAAAPHPASAAPPGTAGPDR